MTKTARGEAKIRFPSGAEVDVADVEKALEHAVTGDAAEAKRQRRIQAQADTMRRLQSMGPGLGWSPELRPHLVAKKRKKQEALAAVHGVTFRRDGQDCLVEAGNGVAFVSIRLPKQAKNAPVLAVVPAGAMVAACQAEDLATFWFRDAKVWVLADDVVSEFFLVQPDLPFEGLNLRKRNKAQRSLAGLALDGALLALVQKALATESLAIRHAAPHVLSLYPAGDDSDQDPDRLGFLATVGGGE